MGAVAAGAVLVALLLIIVAALVWQETRSATEDGPVEYLIDEAARFVYDRLSDRALSNLDLDDVTLVLELGVRYNQTAPGNGSRPVVGSGDAIEYVMERAAATGRIIEPLDIAEVIAAETEYLVSIGAIGDAVEETPT